MISRNHRQHMISNYDSPLGHQHHQDSADFSYISDSQNNDSLDGGSPLKQLSQSYHMGSISVKNPIENMPSFIHNIDQHDNMAGGDESFIEYDTVINSPEKKQIKHNFDYTHNEHSTNFDDNSYDSYPEKNAQWKKYFNNRFNQPSSARNDSSYTHNNEYGPDTIYNRRKKNNNNNNNAGNGQNFHDVTSNIIRYDDYEEGDSENQSRNHQDRSKFIYEMADKTNEENQNSTLETQFAPHTIATENKQIKEATGQEHIPAKKTTFVAFNDPKPIRGRVPNDDRKTSENSNISIDPTADALNIFQNLMNNTKAIFPMVANDHNIQRQYLHPQPTASGLSNATTAIGSASSNQVIHPNGKEKNTKGHKKALSTTTPQDMGMFYDAEMGVWTNPNHTTSMGSANATSNTESDSVESPITNKKSNIRTRKRSLQQSSAVYEFPSIYSIEEQIEEISILPEPEFLPGTKLTNSISDELEPGFEQELLSDLIQKIIELTGQDLESIVEIDLSNNMISFGIKECIDLIFKILPNLLDVNLAGNNIDFLHTITNTNLETLNLSHNLLKSLSFLWGVKLLHLQKLDISSNCLTSVHLQSSKLVPLYKLEELDLSNNSLSSFTTMNLKNWFPNLKKLNLSNNISLEKLEIVSNGLPLHLISNNNHNLKALIVHEPITFECLEIENCMESFIIDTNLKFSESILNLVCSLHKPFENKSNSWQFARSLKSLTMKKYWIADLWGKLNVGLEKLTISEIKNDINGSFLVSNIENNLINLKELIIEHTNLSMPLSPKYDFLVDNLNIINVQILNIKDNTNLRAIFYIQYHDFDQNRMERAHMYVANSKFNNLVMFDGKYITNM